MIIKNAYVYKNDKHFSKEDIYTSNDLLVAKKSFNDSNIIDATGLYLIPGLMDIHFHGAVGEDFSDASYEGLKKIAKYELMHGITSICPASMTLPLDNLINIAENANKYSLINDNTYSTLIGFTMEGPFFSKDKKGAQNEKYLINPSYKFYKKVQDASGGLIKQVCIAPELDGAMSFIKKVSKETVVSLAHTNCDYETAKISFNNGITHITHLYNAMGSKGHRTDEPVDNTWLQKNIELINKAKSKNMLMAEIITDGVHVHKSKIKLAIDVFSEDNMVIISDSLRATGLGEGEFDLGGQKFIVKKNAGWLKESETEVLAGSITNEYDCMKYCINEVGIEKEKAIAMVTMNPAKSIGIFDKYGSIESGKYADMLLVDEDMNIKCIIHRGEMVYNSILQYE